MNCLKHLLPPVIGHPDSLVHSATEIDTALRLEVHLGAIRAGMAQSHSSLPASFGKYP